jgi:hypothetical protein
LTVAGHGRRVPWWSQSPVIGYDNDYHSVGLDVGYFFSPRLSAKLSADLRVGSGLSDEEVIAAGPPALNPIWLNHDRLRPKEHGLLGAALDYVFAEHYDLQVAVNHAVWGTSNGALKYGLAVRLTRSF